MSIKNPTTAKPVAPDSDEEVLAFVDSTFSLIDAGLHSDQGEALSVIETTDEDGKRSFVLIVVVPSPEGSVGFVPIGVLTPASGDFAQSEYVEALLAAVAEHFGTEGELLDLADVQAGIDTFSFIDTTAIEADVESAFEAEAKDADSLDDPS